MTNRLLTDYIKGTMTLFFLSFLCFSTPAQTNSVPAGFNAYIEVEILSVNDDADDELTDADGVFGNPDLRIFPSVQYNSTTFSGSCDATIDDVSIPYTPATPIPVMDQMFSENTVLDDNMTLRFSAHEDDSFTSNCTQDGGDDLPCNNQSQVTSITALTGTLSGGTTDVFLNKCLGNWILTYRITITFVPINDLCVDAISITCGDTISGNTTQATNAMDATACQGTPPDGNISFGAGVWYTFLGTGDTMTLRTDHPGTDFDTQIQLYKDGCGSLTCVDGDDDGGAGNRSLLGFMSEKVTYHVYVDGFSTNSGSFELSLDCPFPVNDSCHLATSLPPVTTSCTLIKGNTGNATDSGTHPDCDDVGSNRDIWYSFVAPANGSIEFERVNGTSGSFVEAAIWSSCGGTVGDELFCSNNFAEGDVLTGLTPGNTYYLQFWDDAGSGQGDFEFCIKIGPDTPVNDNCSNAIALPAIAASCTLVKDSTTYASDSGTHPDCDDSGMNMDIWYSFVAPANGSIEFERVNGTSGSFVEAAIWSSCGGTVGDELFCSNNFAEGDVLTGLTPGNTYYLQFWDDAGSVQGDFEFCLKIGPDVSVNNRCMDALPISCGSSVVDSTLYASKVDTFSSCGTNTDFTIGVWYTFTGTGDTVTLSTDHDTTDFDTEIQVWSGSCGNLVCVGGNDDIGSGNIQSSLRFGTLSCERYYVYVDGHGNNTGVFELSLDCETTCTGNIVTSIADSGPGSLRNVISCATSGDTIRFDPTINGDSIKLCTDFILINKSLTILGNGIGETIIDGSLSEDYILFAAGLPSTEVSFQNMTLQHGGGPNTLLGGGCMQIVQEAHVDLVNCHVLKNEVNTNAGAIVLQASTFKAVNSIFEGNLAAIHSGVALITDGSIASFEQCLFVDNESPAISGVLALGADDSLNIVNCTLSKNKTANEVLVIQNGASASLYNNIIYDNDGAKAAVTTGSGGTYFDGNNLIDSAGALTIGVNGNITGDPMFVDTMARNFDLNVYSAAVNAADIAKIPKDDFDLDGDGDLLEDLPLDLSGSFRVRTCHLDIGAIERQGAEPFSCPTAMNDLCTGADLVTCGSTFAGDISHATQNDRPDPSCYGPDAIPGLWYSFVGTGDSISIEVMGDEPGISVLEGNCAMKTCVAGLFTSSTTVELGFVSTLGTNYLIYIDGVPTSSFTGNITCHSVCPPTLTVAGSPDAGTYEADSSLTSNATIASPKMITYKAGDEVNLNNGFTVEQGAVFEVIMESCNTVTVTGIPSTSRNSNSPVTGERARVNSTSSPVIRSSTFKPGMTRESRNIRRTKKRTDPFSQVVPSRSMIELQKK